MKLENDDICILNKNQISPDPVNLISLSLLQSPSDIKIQLLLEKQYSNLLKILSEIHKNQSSILTKNSIIQSKKFPRYLIQSEVIDYLGKEWIFRKLSDEWGLEPIHNKHKGKLYCSKHVEDICIRFENNLKL